MFARLPFLLYAVCGWVAGAYLPAQHVPPRLAGSGRLAAVCAAAASAEEATPEAVTFPSEAGPIERAKRNIIFASNALPIIASYLKLYLNFQVRERVLGQCLDEDACEVQWEEEHERGSKVFSDVVNELKGFYTKTGQIIATREDLFPRQYSEALSGLTDLVDPMPTSLVRAVISQELLHEGERFDDVFSEFDPEPLGAASVAQVHRARLTEAYGGQVVAVKVQRPAIEAKLLGDVKALKALSKAVQKLELLAVDYYTVFSELEVQLADEFDFINEAAAMERIGNALSTAPDGTPCTPVLVTPRPVGGLVTRRVLVMDYLPGVPLSRAVDEMKRRGIDPESAEAQLFGRQLLGALTTAFGRTILESGFFHADPHPGNIFVLDDGRIGLIDFGQVKQIGARASATLARIMIALSERRADEDDPVQLAEISRLALELGVRLKEDSPVEGPAATAIWLFDGSVDTLPGGFDTSELSPNSPVKVLKSFPQELTLVGRSTVLIKGIASRLGITWSLAKEWDPIARDLLDRQRRGAASSTLGAPPKFRAVFGLLRFWAAGKLSAALVRLPPPIRRVLASVALWLTKRREASKARRIRRSAERLFQPSS